MPLDTSGDDYWSKYILAKKLLRENFISNGQCLEYTYLPENREFHFRVSRITLTKDCLSSNEYMFGAVNQFSCDFGSHIEKALKSFNRSLIKKHLLIVLVQIIILFDEHYIPYEVIDIVLELSEISIKSSMINIPRHLFINN
jgi:hypothetical protein